MKNKEKVKVAAKNLITSILMMFTKGFVSLKLYYWFLFSLTAVNISFFHLLGIVLFIKWIIGKKEHEKEATEELSDFYEEIGRVLGKVFIVPLLALFIGYIFKMLM